MEVIQRDQFLSKVIILILSLTFINTKTSNCRAKFNSDDWVYCTKFGTPDTGGLQIELKARYTTLYRSSEDISQMEFAIYRDQDWENIQGNNKLTCNEKRSRAYYRDKIDIPVSGKFGDPLKRIFDPDNKPVIWYFVVLDCEHDLHQKKSMPKIELEIKMFSDNGKSHFSYEEHGIFELHIYLIIIFACLFGTTIYSYMKYYKDFDRTDSPHFVIALALFFQLGGLFFKILHLWMYQSNGRGIPVLDIFSIISNMMSEITLSCLLIMIASGWTITFQDIDWDNNIECYLPVGSIVIAIHLVLAAMTYIDVDASHKYHDFSGIQGWVLIFFKLSLFAYFLYCVFANKVEVQKKSFEFYRMLLILGSLFFVNVPSTIIGSFLFQPYQRSYIYTLATYLSQMICCGLFLQQQMSTKSKYFKASLSSKGILPFDKLE